MNELILHPTNNPNVLQSMYDWIEYVLVRQWSFDNELSSMCDLERLLTKLKMRRLTPCDLYEIYETHGHLDRLMKCIHKKRDKSFMEKGQCLGNKTKSILFSLEPRLFASFLILSAFNHSALSNGTNFEAKVVFPAPGRPMIRILSFFITYS